MGQEEERERRVNMTDTRRVKGEGNGEGGNVVKCRQCGRCYM